MKMNHSFRITMSSHKLHGDFSVNKGRKTTNLFKDWDTLKIWMRGLKNKEAPMRSS